MTNFTSGREMKERVREKELLYFQKILSFINNTIVLSDNENVVLIRNCLLILLSWKVDK